jgi:transposase-like protein
MSEKESAEKKIRNIRRQNRKKYSAEEKIRIVIEGLRGYERIANLCRRAAADMKDERRTRSLTIKGRLLYRFSS